MTSVRFFTDPGSLVALAAARRICYLVGGYDGSPNFGDALQFLTALSRVEAVGNIRPVALLRLDRRLDHLGARWLGDDARTKELMPLFYDAGRGETEPGLVEVRVPPAASAALYIYGGGFLTEMWGEERIELLRALERWHWVPAPGSCRWRPVLTGQQLSPWVATNAGREARGLLASAALIGVRDGLSARLAGAAVDPDPETMLEGLCDDAFPEIVRRLPADGSRQAAARRPAPGGPLTVNVHLSLAPYTGQGPRLFRLAVDALTRLPAPAPTAHLRLLVAHEGRHIAESSGYAELAALLQQAGFAPEQVVLLADLDRAFEAVATADAAIVMSYHLGLAHLVAGVPTLLLAGNDYYRQKHGGLRELFQVPEVCLVDLATVAPEGFGAAIGRILEDRALRAEIAMGLRQGVAGCARAADTATARVVGLLRDDIEAQDRVAAERMSLVLVEAFERLSRLESAHEQLQRERGGAVAALLRAWRDRFARTARRLAVLLCPPGSRGRAAYHALVRRRDRWRRERARRHRGAGSAV